MPKTVPNQKIIKIHREKLGNNFLGINITSFANAYRDLTPSATILYLYLASNKEGFDLAFSPQAVKNEIEMPNTTCREKTDELIEKGYLVQKKEGSNVFDFYEVPPNRKSENIDFEETETVETSKNSNTEYVF